MTAAVPRCDALELSRRLGWVRSGSALFHRTLDCVADTEFTMPSLLPGWTRAHVAGHLARNADALLNLLTWAQTGVETPMYATTDERSERIASSARRSPAAIRADVRSSTARLAAALEQTPDPAWGAVVNTARSRAVAATEVPWMRAREVWVHAVDLDAGTTFADFPADLARALIADALAGRLPSEDDKRLRVVAIDADLDAMIGPSTGAPVTIAAPVAELLPWVLGRPHPMSDTPVRPPLHPWL